jgi:protein O-GlcNAc transferase
LVRTMWCFHPSAQVESRRKSIGGQITFGCFTPLQRISPTTLELWSRVLQQTPGSKLMLKSAGLDSEAIRDDWTARFATQGVAADRLILLGREQNVADHLARYDQIDIALDTTPYAGTMTSCEALWMGVPLITLAGESHRARVGVSLMSALGLDDLIATSHDRFVEIAVGLADDCARLDELHNTLRQRMEASPLMDARGLAMSIESAYRSAWRTWCSGSGRLT